MGSKSMSLMASTHHQTLLPSHRKKLQCLNSYSRKGRQTFLSFDRKEFNSRALKLQYCKDSIKQLKCLEEHRGGPHAFPWVLKPKSKFPRQMSSHVNATRVMNQSETGRDQNHQWLLLLILKRIGMKLKIWAGKVLEEINPGLEAMEDIRRWLYKNLLISAAFALGLCFTSWKLYSLPSPQAVPYTHLAMNLRCGTVSKVLFEEESHRIFYNLKPQEQEPEEQSVSQIPQLLNTPSTVRNAWFTNLGVLTKSPGSDEWQFSTREVEHDQGNLLDLINRCGADYSSAPKPLLESIRSGLIPMLAMWLYSAPFLFFHYRQSPSTKSSAKKRRSRNKTVGFDDVEGVDTAKTELMEIVSCLRGAIDYSKLGAKIPRGVLLVGPPGTGKTLLARAVAGEAGVPFFTVSASEFIEVYVGRGAARVRDLFDTARKSAPSVIFIDELDAVGGKRGRSIHNTEGDQTLNQLLTEMDGFETENKVVVIAATNIPEALDPALCRPGRFSRKVHVGEPDEDGRRKILSVHLRGVPLEEDQQQVCNLVASLTPGFVGAALANIVNEAALLAARRGVEKVGHEDIMAAIERARFGITEKQMNPSGIQSDELSKPIAVTQY